mmetsp:Transcript_65324/g.73144  ORF Transcript_65324/g.73144 Transcript_65324/m.73144 type:complete len:133 (-) Transcript_65324:39-437(-)
MSTENTSLKNVTPAGDSHTTNETVIGKSNPSQRPLLIVVSSLLALLVLIAVAGNNDGPYFKSSAQESAEGAGALADYQVDTAILAVTQDIFSMGEGNNDDDDDKNDAKESNEHFRNMCDIFGVVGCFACGTC